MAWSTYPSTRMVVEWAIETAKLDKTSTWESMAREFRKHHPPPEAKP